MADLVGVDYREIDVKISEALGHRTFYANGGQGKAWCGGSMVHLAGGAYRYTGETASDGLPLVKDIPRFHQDWHALITARRAILKTRFEQEQFVYELWGVLANVKVDGAYDLSAETVYDVINANTDQHALALVRTLWIGASKRQA